MTTVRVTGVNSNRIGITNTQRSVVRVSGGTTRSLAVSSPTYSVVKSLALPGGGVSRLDDLFDVDASDPNSNETLVYDLATNKYIIKTLPVIDGGEF